jgi:hypothetical protein
MSADYVREAFREVVPPLLTGAGFTFFESVNEAHATKELPPRWFTLDFTPNDDAPAALGQPQLFRESGACTIAIFTAQDIQDATAVDAAEIVRQALVHYTKADVTGNFLRVLDCSPPTDADGGDFRGAWYVITVTVRYQFDRFA